MADQVLPSKLIGERITVRFNFLNELAWGETIAESDVQVYTHVGIDPLPQELLYLNSSVVDGVIVSQQIQLGLPGVIYRIVAFATGSTGEIYEKGALLAVLPTEYAIPPINAVYYTSKPYPLNDIVSVDSESIGFIDGSLLGFKTIDSIESSALLIFGDLYAQLLSYDDWPPEGIDSESLLVSGDLFDVLKSYTMEPEGIDSTAILFSGSLDDKLITYTVPEEGIDSVATLLSGDLT